uniref:RHS repeat-associated core domain-containing protein n=1 Tax=Noviherbaspirillum sp. TaxID=1926288 RepID=UPI002FE00F48
VSDLAALHAAHEQANIADIGGTAAQRPDAYLAQLGRQIGHIDQLLPDGSRHTHVRYRYAPACDEHGTPLGPDAGLDLVGQTDAENHSRAYVYASHLLTRFTDYNGFGYQLSWHTNADWAPFPTRCIRTVADDGSQDTRLDYNPAFNETVVTDAAGNKAVYTYNHLNLITGVETFAPDGSHPWFQRVWDKDGNLIKDIDPEGRTTRYRYDARGNLLAVTGPAGATTRYEYDASSNPVKIIDPAGRPWQREYDVRGNLIKQTDPAGRSTDYQYDSLGELIGIIDAKGGSKTLTYNEFGQLVSHTDCSGKTTRFSYNPLGHLIASTDAARNITRYDTDRLGRVTRVIRPDGSSDTLHHDPLNNLTAAVDANGAVTRYGYNGHGQLTHRRDANGNSLAYRYNANLQLIQLINQNGEAYDFRYDHAGRLSAETGFDGKTTEYDYDSGGRLIGSISGKIRTDYLRDDSGRLLQKTVHQPTGRGPVTHTTRYQYDVMGRLLWASGKDGDVSYEYDAAGNLIGETQRVKVRQGGQLLERVFTLKHEVDELGNRIQTTLPNGRKVGTQRYGSGHWIGTLWNGSPIVDIERDDLHREKVRQLGRSAVPQQRLTQSRSYDPLSRLTGLNLRGPNHELLAARSHVYDAVGNLTRIQDQIRGTLSYDYDPVGQLLKATQPNLAETFQFDPAGNLTDGTPQKAVAPINKAGKDHDSWEQGLDHLTEQPLNATKPKLAPVTHNLLKSYLNTAFDYDAEGNVIRKVVKGAKVEQPYSLNLHYDAENRLVKAIRPGLSSTIEAEYKYDVFGRRTAKIVRTLQQAQASGTYGGTAPMEAVREDITFFVWDGDTLIQEVQPDTTVTYLYQPETFVPLAQVHSDTPDSAYDAEEVQKKPAQEEQQAAAWEQEAENLKWLKVTDAKAHELAIKAIEERNNEQRQQAFKQLKDEAQGDRIYYVNTDHLGTPQEVLSEDGKVVWLAKYRAWGRVHALDKEEVKQPLRFQGQYEDRETGLFYNRYRYYDPDTARYIMQDPIGLVGGTNPFSYAPSSTGWIDPLGLSGKPLPNGTQVNRIGGNSIENLRLKEAETKLNPPGISVLHSTCPANASKQMREAFPKATGLQQAAGTVSSGSADKIREAGFDVIEDPTKKFPNHARIVHPAGAGGFTDENLAKLSQALGTTTKIP